MISRSSQLGMFQRFMSPHLVGSAGARIGAPPSAASPLTYFAGLIPEHERVIT